MCMTTTLQTMSVGVWDGQNWSRFFSVLTCVIVVLLTLTCGINHAADEFRRTHG